MGKDYSKTANTALKLIKKFGLPSLLIRDESVANPLPYEPPPTPLLKPYACQAVKLPAGQRDISFLPEGTSLSTTAKILIDAVELEIKPSVGNQVEHKGTQYQIISVKPLQPAEVDVMWTVYVNI